MTLKERIYADFVEAFKARTERKKSALSFLKAKIMEAEKANKNIELNDEETLKVLLLNVKQRKQSIEDFEKGGRTDLIEKEKEELSYLEVYLPTQLSREEIVENVKAILGEAPTGNRNKQVGILTGMMNKKFKGQLDNKLLSEVINELVP